MVWELTLTVGKKTGKFKNLLLKSQFFRPIHPPNLPPYVDSEALKIVFDTNQS